MPLYEFYCEACQKDFESIMKPFDPVACPICGTSEVNKQFSSKVRHKMTGDNSASTTPKRDRVY